MITLQNGTRLVESASELPDLRNARRLYQDYETTSFVNDEKALYPYRGHRACGIAVTVDDAPGAWYVPIRHRYTDGTMQPGNVPLEAALAWSKDNVETCEEWVNFNVKFDAHFAAVDGALFRGRLRCLTTMAKLHDSDRLYKGGYGADALASAWLEKDITPYEQAVKAYLDGVRLPKRKKAHDYGLVPIDTMAPYAGEDVITAREMDHYLTRVMSPELNRIRDVELMLTPVLWDIEREGMLVDPDELQLKEMELLIKLTGMEERLHGLIGHHINPTSSDDLFDTLINKLGLPVLLYNKDNNPSFDKAALAAYMVHPEVVANEGTQQIVSLVQEYRKLNTLLTFFVRPYQEHQVDRVMHPDYNQAVRSGRMSCKRPNAQQLSKAAKELIHPGDGQAFLSCDYSQVEFRLIVHYLQADSAIRSYLEDPDTDFHQWVAEMCGIPRRPAKNVNFAIGYGAGKGKVTRMLAANVELVGSLGTRVDEMIARHAIHESQRKDMFDALCNRRAVEVFDKYHAALPSLRHHTRNAAGKIRSRGYVMTAYGRQLRLPEKAAHHAFNRIVQGCAADINKERLVALAPRYNSTIRELGVRIAANVHDETLFRGPRDLMRDPKFVRATVEQLEDTGVKFSVPIRCSAGYSATTWAEASGDDGELEVIRGDHDDNPNEE